ncbi:MAG: folylpolyglutamate synthase/dihydrofolate synthase family protein [Rhodothermia bacterium]
MTYRQACDFLFGLPSWSRDGAYHPGLTRMQALLDGLGNPDRSYPIVHVAGTNGKGSVCAMIAAMVSAGGNRVGLHTSPHLFSFAERMRVDGMPAPEDWIARTTAMLARSICDNGASFFEASTAMALLYFAEHRVDLGVVEVGMGGRLDATNVVTPEVSVITNIGFDHTEHLGATLSEIASEKAGIIKPGIPVVSGCCQAETRAVIRLAADRSGSRLLETCGEGKRQLLTGLELDLGGEHQVRNAVVAIESVDVLSQRCPAISPDIRAGLSRTRRLSGLRGRCQILSRSPVIVADVAHNPEGIGAALRFMESEDLMGDQLHVLLGLATDKDVDRVLDVLAGHAAVVIPARIENPRLLPPAVLAARAREKGLRILEIASHRKIVTRFMETSPPGDSLLATGSHLVVGSLPQAMFESADSNDGPGGKEVF